MNKKNEIISIFNNSEITSAQDVLNILEHNEDKNIKWQQNNGTSNQVVIKIDEYYYKLYLYDRVMSYTSLIRYKLAEIYRGYGIYWEIITVETERGLLDIEKRQKLEVCDKWDDSILKQFSKTLKELEKQIGFDIILDELKKVYPEVYKIKLVFDSINKASDYAVYNDKIILLDDTDWVLVPLNYKNEILELSSVDIKFKMDNDWWEIVRHDLTFTPIISDIFNRTTKLSIRKIVNKNTMKQVTETLRQKSEKQFDDMVKILAEEDSDNDIDADMLYSPMFKKKLYLSCNKKMSVEQQLQLLKDWKKQIDNIDFSKFNAVNLCIFSSPLNKKIDRNVLDLLLSIIDKIFFYYSSYKLGIIELYLIDDDYFISGIKNLINKYSMPYMKEYDSSGINIITTLNNIDGTYKYDMGTWQRDINYLTKYPFVKVTGKFLLTGNFVDDYINEKIDFNILKNKFNINIGFEYPSIFSLYGTDFEQQQNEDNETYFNRIFNVKKEINKQFNYFPKRKQFIKFIYIYVRYVLSNITTSLNREMIYRLTVETQYMPKTILYFAIYEDSNEFVFNDIFDNYPLEVGLSSMDNYFDD